MKRIAAALAALLATAVPTLAQWQVPVNSIPYGRGVGTGFSRAAAAANSILATNGSNVPGLTTTLPNAVQDNITRLGTIASGVWSGTTIAVTRGGTGLTAGTSGGIPYFSGTTTMASSAALTANLPIVGGGAGGAPVSATRSGNTTTFVTSTGALTSGDCVSIDASGNFVAAGGACTTGGGGGTVTASTAGQVAWYSATGATVIGSTVLGIYSGNVGIGNVAPTTKLEVGALPSGGYLIGTSANFNAPADTAVALSINRGGLANPQGILFGVNQASLYSEIQAAQSNIGYNKLLLNRQGGNVGIGTATPVTLLDVEGNFCANSAGAAIFYAQCYGVVADGVTNDTAAMQAVIDAASVAGGIVQMPKGQILLNSGLTMTTEPITLRGVGNAPGVVNSPGTVQEERLGATTLVANWTTGDVILATGLQGFVFEDFQISSNVGARVSGAGIKVVSSYYNGNGNTQTAIRRVQTFLQYDGFYFDGPASPQITFTRHVDWANVAIKMIGNAAYETSAGTIANNLLQDTTAASYAGIELHQGYGNVLNNIIISSNIGIYWIVDTYAAGRMRIAGNVIENQLAAGIYAIPGNSITGSMLMIQDNEFSVFNNTLQAYISIQPGPSNWLDNVHISGNTFRGATTNAGSSFINVQAGENVQITNNTLNGMGGTANGISTGGNITTPILVADNTLVGTFTAKYILGSITILRDLVGLTFAQLVGGNGSQVFVTDGATGSPCTGGGTGSMSFRQNNAWKCF